MQQPSLRKISVLEKSATIMSTSFLNPAEFDWYLYDEIHLDSIPGRTVKHYCRRVEAEGARLD
jgi:predicted phosphoadenosine phosphosulfate sulfurtransferase